MIYKKYYAVVEVSHTLYQRLLSDPDFYAWYLYIEDESRYPGEVGMHMAGPTIIVLNPELRGTDEPERS